MKACPKALSVKRDIACTCEGMRGRGRALHGPHQCPSCVGRAQARQWCGLRFIVAFESFVGRCRCPLRCPQVSIKFVVRTIQTKGFHYLVCDDDVMFGGHDPKSGLPSHACGVVGSALGRMRLPQCKRQRGTEGGCP